MVWPAAIGAAGAIGSAAISSAFSGSKRISPHDDMSSMLKGTRKFGAEQKRLDMRHLVSAAREAGIHPLAALGSPVSSGSATPIGSTVTGNSRGDGIASAVGQAARGIADKLDRRRQDEMAEESHSASLEESRARTRALNAEAAATVRRSHAETSVINSAAARLVQGSNSRQDLPQVSTVTTPSGNFKTGATTRQQEVEDEYGGVVGEGYGIWRWLNDLVDNVREKTPVEKTDEFSWFPKFKWELY